MADQELSDEQAKSLGLDDQEPAPQQLNSGDGPNGAPPLPTAIGVKEPDGAPAPIGVQDRVLSDDEAKSLGLDDAPPVPTPTQMRGTSLGYIAGNAQLPESGRAADIIKYSAASGLPADVVAADLEGVKKRMDAAGVDWKKLAERQPALAQYLSENPHAIPLAQDDTKNLGVIEWALGGHPITALMDAIHEQGTTGLQFLRAEGVKGLEPAIEQRLADEQKSSSQYGADYGAHNLLMKGIVSTMKFAPYMALDWGARALGGALGALGGGAAGIETGPGAIATTAAGAGAGEFISSGIFNYAETLGPYSWQIDHARDAQGRPIDPTVANIAAQTAAIASGAFMSGSMGLFGKTAAAQKVAGWAQGTVLPGVQKAIQGLAESSLVKWLGDNEVRDAISKAVGRWGLHVGIGMGMIAGNSAITAGATEAAKAASGQDANLSNVSNAMVQSGAQAFKDLWLMSAVPSVRGYLKDQGEARESAEAAVKLGKSIEAAKQSTLLDKSPEAFEQYVNLAAPNAKVYVPADRWMSYFQEKKLDPAEVAQRVGVAPEVLTNAVSTGGTLEIPADKFLSQLAKDGHADGLSMDIKSSPELLTAREFKAKQDSEAKRLVDDAKTRATELDDGKKAIENFVIAQAKASKVKVADVREGAKIMSEAAATQALRLNVSMQESARLMNFGDLSISGKEGPTPAHEAAARSFREWMAPSAAQELAKRQATLSPENKARELYLDKNTGLPNGLHFEDLNQHEAAQSFEPGSDQLFGHAGIEGTKFVNDQRDHGQGNLLYRATGKALHEADPTASVSKTGGDFELRVRDQDHLDEILKKANENLPPELKGFTITGAVGDSREAAEKAHVELKQTAETAGTRAERGKPPLAFQGDIKTLKLPEAKSSVEVHPELAKQVADMTPEEYFNKAYVEPKTGLLTNLGWQNLAHDPSYHYAALDLRGLKDANARYGKEGGDGLIEGFGTIVSHYGGSSFDAAHLHGDEYALRHRDSAKLVEMVERVKEKLTNVFEATEPDGEKADVSVRFWHGISRGSYEAADRALNERKAAAKAEASLLPGRAPAGDEAHGDSGGRQASLQFQREALGRGAAPQAYPGSDRVRFSQEAVVPKPVLDAQAFIGRMKDADKKSSAQAFLEYATGKTDQRPEITPKLEQEFADKFGIVDPHNTYPFDESGRSMERPIGGKKVFGKEPDELRRFRLETLEHRTGKQEGFKQEPIAYIEGKPVTFEQAQPTSRVDTPEFKRWFGDSKVVGTDGKPLVVFHGTNYGGFDSFAKEFQDSRGLKGPGFYFTADPDVASGYSDASRDKVAGEGGAPSVYPVHLSIQHPLDENAPAATFVKQMKEFKAKAPPADIKRMIDSALRDESTNFSTEGLGMWVDNTERAYNIADKAGKNGEELIAPYEDYVISKARDYILKQVANREFWEGKDILNFIDKHVIVGSKEVAGGLGLPQGDNGNIRHVLEKLGFDGIAHTGGGIVGEKAHQVWIAFRPEQVKSATGNRGTFDPNDPSILRQDPPDKDGNPRGEIRLDVSGSGRPRAFDIRMLNSDKSTFVHEAAHFLSWSLHDLATSDLATPQIKEDYATLLKFAGYESADARLEGLKAGTNTAQEEKISHGFEQYLSEGKAPSRPLARVFSRFKDWLLRIYKGTEGVQSQYEQRYGQKLELSDDVRAVFDRLLAQDEALKQAGQAVGGTGELKEAVAGMTPEQAAEYRKKLEDAKTDADQETAQGGGDRQKAMDAQREVFRKQTEAELDQQPVYRAWRYLQHGDTAELEGGSITPEQFKAIFTDEKGKPFKMDRADFVEKYGEDVAKLMPPGSLKAKGGLPAEVIASLLGYQSGDEMVKALREAVPRDRAVTQGTQDKMDAAHGPEFERATEAGLSGVHNDAQLEATVMELRSLAKQINPAFERQARAINTDTLRKNIDRMTGEKLVSDLDPAHYAGVERKLALEAAELWGKGEKEASYDKREQRLVNKLLFMSERDAKKELESARDRIERPSDSIRGNMGKGNPAYRDAHDSILSAVGLGAPAQGEATLDDMLKVAQDSAQDIDFDVDGIRNLMANPQDWAKLSVEKARNVVDAVTNIRTAARRSLEIKIGGKRLDRDEFIQKLVSTLKTARPPGRQEGVQRSAETAVTKAVLTLQSIDANLSDMDTLAHMLDGGDRNGPWHQLLVDERHADRDVVTKLAKGVAETVLKKFESMPKEVKQLMSEPVDLSELPVPPALERFKDNRTRETLHAIFLNWGNAGNQQRLLDGTGWTRDAVERALSKLHPAEVELLQSVLDVTDSLYEPMAANHEEDTGLRPEKVSATPITVNGQEYRGGYFPAKYDFRGSRVGARQLSSDIKNVAQVFAEAGQRPSLSKSHTKERADKVVDAPLDLSIGVAAAHLSSVINDIAYRSYVKDGVSVILDERVRNAIEETVGPERYKQLMPMFQTVATGRSDSAPANLSRLQQVNSWFRTRMAIQSVGWSLRSAAGVVTDPLNAVAAGIVSPVSLTPALLKTWNPVTYGDMRESALALSPEIQFREQHRESSLRDALGQALGSPKGTMQKLRDTAFWFHIVADKRNETAVFTGRFNQSIAEGKTQEAAIRDGDDAVRAVTPTPDPADKAAILRSDSGIASLLVFYGYANKVFNLHRRNFDSMYLSLVGDKPTGEKAKDLAKYAGTAMALMVSHGVVSEYMTGRGKEDDEDEAHWALRKALLAPLNTLPFMGSIAESLVTGKRISIRSAPAAAFLEDTATRLAKLAKTSDSTSEDKLLSLVEMVAGFATGAPTAAVHRPIDYSRKARTGEARSRGPLDAAGGTVYGAAKGNPANPLTDLQTAISGK